MRILLAGTLDAGDAIYREVDTYRAAGQDLVVNIFYLDQDNVARLAQRYQSDTHVAFRSFSPSSHEALLAEITNGQIGYDAIVYPPDLHGLTDHVIAAATSPSLAHTLKVVGCPNDVIRHLSAVEKQGIRVENSSDIHARAVAEYTLIQIGFHARKIGQFYETTGESGVWPHHLAASTTISLAGKTLGVIGATGKDGSAVVLVARKLGLRVVGMGSGRPEGNARIREMGATVASSVEELLGQSDFLSVNSAKAKTLGLIGKNQFARLKPGVIIVNPAGAEIIDKEALLEEFSKPVRERRVGAVILDMPYGGRRGDQTFSFDPDNAKLKALGVLFTPRMAGYTIDTYTHGVEQVAAAINRRLLSVPTTRDAGEIDSDTLTQDIIVLAKKAGETAVALRKAGLVLCKKADGTVSTNADTAAEELIRDGLRKRGYCFTITGEELGEESPVDGNVMAIIDGIDGTRNFRDDNYGWCTSICVMKGQEIIIGVVHDPKCGETYWAIKGKGAFRSDGVATETLRTPEQHPEDFSFSIGSFRVQGSTVIKHQMVEDIKKLGGRQREWGSIALSICGTARGGLGGFIQGNAELHDYGAALLIAAEAGAGISCMPSETGKRDILVAHPELFLKMKSIFSRRLDPAPDSAASRLG
jgi:fructose-1,6-bisphosphatase/inositol monophosphatase family enzyme/phosphoglycerate dehydrogenase-like enzyme